MSVHTSVDPRLLQQIGDNIRQLTEPIHIAIRRQVVTHPPLLDQLRAATQPGTIAYDTGRRTTPASRPAANLQALDTLSSIYVELAGWHARHRLPSPARDVDWHKAVMRQLVGLAPNLAGSVADWLAADIYEWWRLAATTTGWRPDDLRKLR